MIKILDLDGLFDEYIKSYVYENVGKVNPEEIENQIPVLYSKFGEEKLKELDGKTPSSYYKDFSMQELIGALLTHIEKEVSVSDFLCEAIISKKEEVSVLINALGDDNNEQFTLYLMNFLSDMNADIPPERFLDLALLDYSEPIKELATEMLTKKADKVKERLVSEFSSLTEKNKEYAIEILSNVKLKEDAVFDILVKEFVRRADKIPYYASLLAKYGDERAVPFIKTVIEDEKISYADFEELRFALEVLGEVYDKERDFSKDKFYNKIKGKRPTLR